MEELETTSHINKVTMWALVFTILTILAAILFLVIWIDDVPDSLILIYLPTFFISNTLPIVTFILGINAYKSNPNRNIGLIISIVAIIIGIIGGLLVLGGLLIITSMGGSWA